jgi:hypothetical protein
MSQVPVNTVATPADGGEPARLRSRWPRTTFDAAANTLERSRTSAEPKGVLRRSAYRPQDSKARSPKKPTIQLPISCIFPSCLYSSYSCRLDGIVNATKKGSASNALTSLGGQTGHPNYGWRCPGY